MTTTFSEIIEWVKDLDFWEQAAFDLVVSGKEVTDDDFDLLVKYLLEDNGLVENGGKRPDFKFKDYLLAGEDGAVYQLTKISNLRNINALAADQTLEFGSNLTAIFGATGSGKSGYARVLGSAGFTRGDEEIFPDITKPFDSEAPQLVDIELDCEGKKVSFEHIVGTPFPQLSSFYIFDSTSVIVHLTKKNTISFSPSGLSCLQDLTVLTDEVRDKLKHQIEEKERPNNFEPLFHGTSVIRDMVSSLSYETDIGELRSLANFTSDDAETLTKLKDRSTTIETKGIPNKIRELEQNKTDLSQLISKIEKVVSGLGKEVIDEITQDIMNANTHLAVANRLGLESFKAGKLKTVGTEEWHTFINAAKALSTVEVEDDEHPYPHVDSYCLLCQQLLSKEAQELINQLWSYLESEVQEQLRSAEQVVLNQLDSIKDLDTSYFEYQLVVSRLVLERNADLHSAIKSHRDMGVAFKQNAQKSIEDRQEIKYTDIETDIVSKVEKIIEQIEGEIVGWREEVGEVENLQEKIREYEHRRLLSKHLSQIEAYIHELIWIEKASKIGGSTRHITRKYNQMFSELVTDEYVKLFEKTLEELGRPLKVLIATRARKGEVYKQLVLEADESTPARLVNPDKILSEGEKRAVALADFLTEIALDTSSRGIILDDPVTSLDIDWRRKIAEVLVEESKDRQVIVFTHDMLFLYYLREESEKEGVPTDNHWIKRGDTDDCPGHIYLHNSPALEQDYRNDRKARNCFEKAKEAPPEEQQALIREGFGALRTAYEVMIMYDLFKSVVKRFEERTSFMNLKNVAWNDDLADAIVEKCELCSGLMEGHSHSDALAAEFPTPDYLLAEIEEYNKIRKAVRALKK